MTVSPKGYTLTSPDCKPTETRNKDTRQRLQLRKGSRTALLKEHEKNIPDALLMKEQLVYWI